MWGCVVVVVDLVDLVVLVVLALVEANMDNPLDLSEVFLRFRLRNPGLEDNWMDVDIVIVWAR